MVCILTRVERGQNPERALEDTQSTSNLHNVRYVIKNKKTKNKRKIKILYRGLRENWSKNGFASQAGGVEVAGYFRITRRKMRPSHAASLMESYFTE